MGSERMVIEPEKEPKIPKLKFILDEQGYSS